MLDKYTYGEFVKSLDNVNIDSELISAVIRSFWSKVFANYPRNYIYVYIVIEYEGEVFKSLGKVAMVNIKDCESYITKILLHFDLKENFYHEAQAKQIIVFAKLADDEIELDSNDNVVNSISVIHTPKKEENTNSVNMEIKGYNLPVNTNTLSWGKIIDNGSKWFVIEYISRDRIYHLLVERTVNGHLVTIMSPSSELIGKLQLGR